MLTYDFPQLAEGKAIPYGTYDLAQDRALVNVGVSPDTAEFAGRLEYPLLKDSCSAGLWEEWRRALRATPSRTTRWWHRARLATLLIFGRLGNWTRSSYTRARLKIF